MENETKLSVFGWLIVLAVIAGIIYWFSLPISIEETAINVLSSLTKSLILSVFFVVHCAALYNKRSLLAIYSSIITFVLVFETFIFNNDAINSSTQNSVWILGFFTLIVGGVSTLIAVICLINYIMELMDPKTDRLQALKNSLAQNSFTKLMFKQSKQEKPIEKVKI